MNDNDGNDNNGNDNNGNGGGPTAVDERRGTTGVTAVDERRGTNGGDRGKRDSGILIAVEGLDGSGKSTQIRLLYEWLYGLRLRVHFSEWNSSEIVKGATKRGKKQQILTPTTFSLIHATDFADRYERQILPMLRGGYIVLCDRYIFTSFARDGVRGCDPAWLRHMYGFARVPDYTFYFRLPLDAALGRILEGRPALKYFEAGMDLGLSNDIYESFRLFQGRVMDQYEHLSDEFGFVRIDATRNVHDQQMEVRNIIEEGIDLSRYRTRVARSSP